MLTSKHDKIDEIILSCLVSNARMSAHDITQKLYSAGIKRSPRTILERINKLEKKGRITGYTLKTSSDNFNSHVMRLVLISFKTSNTFNKRIDVFTRYLQNAPFTAFAARTRGEYDWVNIKIFPNEKIANEESDIYRTFFGDIIEKYFAADLTIVKAPNFVHSTNYKISEFYEFCQSWTKKY
jgi:DNA-binding Lrp family transcriptional regulator